MIVVRRVGVPSSSMPSLPQSFAQPVVVGGHEALGELLADLAGVDAGPLLHRVGLQPVAHRLVEQHPTEAVADHHRQAASGGVHGLELRERAPAAVSATASGSASPCRKPAWPPRVSVPVSTRASRRATTCAPRRTRVWSSAAARPSELNTSTWRRASESRSAPASPPRLPRGRASSQARNRSAFGAPPPRPPARARWRARPPPPPPSGSAVRAPLPRRACASESATLVRSASSRPSTWP